MNWAKHPPVRSRASFLGYAHLSFADRAASAGAGDRPRGPRRAGRLPNSGYGDTLA